MENPVDSWFWLNMDCYFANYYLQSSVRPPEGPGRRRQRLPAEEERRRRRTQSGMNCIKISVPGKLTLGKRKGLLEVQGLLILYIWQRIAQMGQKKTAVLFSRKLFLYTVNLAPPGGKFKFLILFCLWKLPGALDQKSCLMQSKAESNSA